MIRFVMPIFILGLLVSTSFAQIFNGQLGGGLGNRLGDRPILSRFVQPSYPTLPGFPSTQPVVSNGVRALGNGAIFGLGLANSDTLTGIAYGIGPAIRLARVAVAGSPYPGDRKNTLLWVASPTAIQVREFIRDRRGGAPVFENGYRIFGKSPGFQQPIAPGSGYTQPMMIHNGCDCYGY